MPLEFVLTIRDPIHGLMRFTAPERLVIDLPAFQRLRGLKQSSLAHYTYPTALTSRFEHSLGTCQVGDKLWLHLKDAYPKELAEVEREVLALYADVARAAVGKDGIADSLRQGIRLACLLHDIGHLPFSHCFEDEIKSALATTSKASAWGTDVAMAFTEASKKLAGAELEEMKLHEFIGYYILATHPSIKEACASPGSMIAREIALDILNPVHSPRGNSPILQQVLGRIVHGEIDADRIDFLQRDAGMSGSGLGNFDSERLVSSMAIHKGLKGLELLPSARGLSALEGFFVARLSLYRWQYHHHNVVFNDLLLRLLVRTIAHQRLGEEIEIDLLREISFERMIQIQPNPSETLPWPSCDDGLIWLILTKAYVAVKDEGSQLPADDRRRLRIMLEELLYRSGRHVSLWRDPHGFSRFSTSVEAAIAAPLGERLRKGSVQDGIHEWCTNAGDPTLERAANLTSLLVRRVQAASIDRFQEWLWNAGYDELLVDTRKMAAFRRLGKLSELHVCGTGDDSNKLIRMTKLSEILRGLADPGVHELRFFAYRLFLTDEIPKDGDRRAAAAEEGRGRLAEALCRYSLQNHGILNEEDEKYLGLKA